MTDKLTPKRRSENMRRIRSTNTSPELIVRRLVHALGFRFRLHVATLPGKPDLVFAGPKKIIEVRGCFWHQHRGCIDSHIPKTRVEYWQPKLAKNKYRDEKNRRKLKRLGWQLLNIWECEVSDIPNLSRRVIQFLEF